MEGRGGGEGERTKGKQFNNACSPFIAAIPLASNNHFGARLYSVHIHIISHMHVLTQAAGVPDQVW